MSRLAQLAQKLKQSGGSALHVGADRPIRMRTAQRLTRVDGAPMTATEIETEVRTLAGPGLWERIQGGEPGDFTTTLAGERYHLRCFVRHGGPALVLRTTASLISFDDLGLPATVRRLAHLRRGLVVVAGPTGAGKSTTVAAMLNEIDEGRPKHVATIESPIELTFTQERTSISQREVGTHTESFATGLRAALRQGADVVFASDLPTAETVCLALEIVASGRLVVATVRASGATRAIERLVDHGAKRRAILNGVAEHLSAVVSQRRVQKADGRGHVAAVELLVRSRSIVAALRDDELSKLTSILERSDSMQTMDDALAKLLEQKQIAFEDAYDHARDKARFRNLREGARRVMRRTRHQDDR